MEQILCFICVISRFYNCYLAIETPLARGLCKSTESSEASRGSVHASDDVVAASESYDLCDARLIGRLPDEAVNEVHTTQTKSSRIRVHRVTTDGITNT